MSEVTESLINQGPQVQIKVNKKVKFDSNDPFPQEENIEEDQQ